MPRIDSQSLPQVNTQAVSGGGLNVRASPEAFGAGIGDALVRSANVYDDIQTQADIAKAQEAENQYRTWVRDRGAQYSELRARDAYDGFGQLENDFLSKQEEFSKTLDNDRQREYFKKSTTGLMQGRLDSYRQYSINQLRDYNAGVEQAAAENAISDAAMFYNSPEERAAAYQKGLAHTLQLAEIQGATDPEQIQQMKRDFASKFHLNVFNNILSSGDTKGAEAYFLSNQKEIDGALHDNIKTKLKGDLENDQAMAVFGANYVNGMTPQALVEKLQADGVDEKTITKILPIANQRYNAYQENEKQLTQSYIDDVNGQLDSGVEIDEIRKSDAYRALSPTMRRKVEKEVVEGRKTDPDAYLALNQAVERGDISDLNSPEAKRLLRKLSPQDEAKFKQLYSDKELPEFSDLLSKLRLYKGWSKEGKLEQDKLAEGMAFQQFAAKPENKKYLTQKDGLDFLARQWVTKGDNYSTFGEAFKKGKADQFIPDSDEYDPEAVGKVMSMVGLTSDDEDLQGEFYQKTYVPAARWLSLHGMQPDPELVGLHTVLDKQGVEINDDNFRAGGVLLEQQIPISKAGVDAVLFAKANGIPVTKKYIQYLIDHDRQK